jgi:hypothetical protein
LAHAIATTTDVRRTVDTTMTSDDGEEDRMAQALSSDVWVEVTAMCPRISGVVHRQVDADVQFDGWLELMSVLERDGTGTPSG